jgi:hypothetical protein
VSRFSRQYGILIISQPSRLPRPLTELAFIFLCMDLCHLITIFKVQYTFSATNCQISRRLPCVMLHSINARLNQASPSLPNPPHSVECDLCCKHNETNTAHTCLTNGLRLIQLNLKFNLLNIRYTRLASQALRRGFITISRWNSKVATSSAETPPRISGLI